MKVLTSENKIISTYNVSCDYRFPLQDFKSSSACMLGKDVLKLFENQADMKRKILGEFTQHKLQKLRI